VHLVHKKLQFEGIADRLDGVRILALPTAPSLRLDNPTLPLASIPAERLKFSPTYRVLPR
jgi:hypothetical protein